MRSDSEAIIYMDLWQGMDHWDMFLKEQVLRIKNPNKNKTRVPIYITSIGLFKTAHHFSGDEVTPDQQLLRSYTSIWKEEMEREKKGVKRNI